MASTRRKQDDRNLETLRELIAVGENRYCFDCGTRGPTYVNTTVGSFVCSRCSGMLRGLAPPHRVKSISMATFTNEEMDLIKSRGNDYCHRIWLGLYEGENPGKDEQSIRDFMSDKYEKKRYHLDPEIAMRNGDFRSKLRKDSTSSASAAPLISILPQSQTSNRPPPTVNNLISPLTVSNFVPRPTNNSLTTNANITPSPQVPEFAVDFSKAYIYNSSAYNNNTATMNNSSATNNANTFNSFKGPMPPSDDRYAALAVLDIELRQQKCLNANAMDSAGTAAGRNPFQANSNPFSNGVAWGAEPPRDSAYNPFAAPPSFAPSATTNGFGNSKNPFL